jgi:hypothetical protein
MGAKEDRNLITGLHTVADVYCNSCQTVLGWKYVSFLLSPLPLALSCSLSCASAPTRAVVRGQVVKSW